MLKLKEHQLEAIEFLSKRRCAWLQYEMGLGKTVITLEHIKNKIEFLKPILIVCPKNVIPVWGQEVDKWKYDLSVTELTGTTTKRITKLKSDTDLFVINYEALRYLPSHLYKKGFNTIILDESHRIKDRGAKQTEIVHNLGQAAKFRYALTGTPVTKSPEDIWSQAYFLHRRLLPNFWSFCSRYITYKSFEIFKDPKNRSKGKRTVKKALYLKKSKNELGIPYNEELNMKLNQIVLRKTKDECLDLPDKIYKKIEVDLTKEQRKLYKELRGELKLNFTSHKIDKEKARASVQKLQQVCQGFLYDSEHNPMFVKSCKINALKDLLEDLEGKKIIIFTWYKADVVNILNNVKDRDILVYDGSDEERKEAIRRFQEEDKPYIFLSNVERAKEGITLTASSDVIYFGNSYNYGTRSQSEDRAHRTGQSNHVVYYDIVAKGTVDERVTEILTGKKKMADEVTLDSYRLAKMDVGDE